MVASPPVISIGAVCFGIVTGYIAHRTLLRKSTGAQISDLAAVLAAVGGGVVAGLFPMDGTSDSFGWYAIGLLAGMVLYFVNFRLHNGAQRTAEVLGDGTAPRQPGAVPALPDSVRPDSVRPDSAWPDSGQEGGPPRRPR